MAARARNHGTLMPVEEWDSYPGFDDEDDDVDCLGPDDPDDWISEGDED